MWWGESVKRSSGNRGFLDWNQRWGDDVIENRDGLAVWSKWSSDIWCSMTRTRFIQASSTLSVLKSQATFSNESHWHIAYFPLWCQVVKEHNLVDLMFKSPAHCLVNLEKLNCRPNIFIQNACLMLLIIIIQVVPHIFPDQHWGIGEGVFTSLKGSDLRLWLLWQIESVYKITQNEQKKRYK